MGGHFVGHAFTDTRILVKTIRPMVCQGLKRMTPLHPFQSRILARWTTAKRGTMYSLKAMELLMFGFERDNGPW